jgi:hypothetical protein
VNLKDQPIYDRNNLKLLQTGGGHLTKFSLSQGDLKSGFLVYEDEVTDNKIKIRKGF